jgi:hypothetical protein
MSALPPKADKQEKARLVRFVPKADICTAANCSLFDHLVGAHQQRRRHFEAERFGCGEVDDEIEFVRLLARNIGGLVELLSPGSSIACGKLKVDGECPPSVHICFPGFSPADARGVIRHTGKRQPINLGKVGAGNLLSSYHNALCQVAGRVIISVAMTTDGKPITGGTLLATSF